VEFSAGDLAIARYCSVHRIAQNLVTCSRISCLSKSVGLISFSKLAALDR
jgi:hypothetical protein